MHDDVIDRVSGVVLLACSALNAGAKADQLVDLRLDDLDPSLQRQRVVAAGVWKDRRVSEDDIVQFVTSLPGVGAVMASQATGAPEVAWGDWFIFYDREGESPPDRRFPFATIVTKDYDGWDTFSQLNRPGIFRLNIAVGRHRFEDLIGYPPAEHAKKQQLFDYTAMDLLLPHPVYGSQGWVSILNPGEGEQAKSLLTEAHARATERRRP